MDIIAITRQLGEAIQADTRYVAFAEAKKLNDEDTALQDAIGQFNLIRMSLNNELSKADKSDEKVKEYNENLRKTYGEIMRNPNMLAYNQAKSDLDELVNQINSMITLCVNGEDPKTVEPASNCGGDCSGCSGCH